LREGRWWPDLVGRVTWDTATGRTRDDDVILGSGFNEIQGALTATKRQDPLAFIGSASYQKAFENDDIKPGDELTFNIGTVLAASPETSLRFFLEQSFINEIEIDGRKIDGSDLVVGSLNVGGSVILGPRLLLDVVAGVGLTDDAPDYSVTVSLPFRFDLPIAN
jgi:Putative MetA-pathway of phenol degradation